VRAYGEEQNSYRILIHLVRIPWCAQQAWRHLRHSEFTTITGSAGYMLWKIGALGLMKRFFRRELKIPAEKPPARRAATTN